MNLPANHPRVRRLRLLEVGLLVAGLLLIGLLPASAGATRQLITGIDPAGAPSTELWGNRTAATGAEIVRTGALWRDIAASQPESPRDPGDPAYNFTSVDNSVKSIAAHGQSPLLVVELAPDWAEGGDRPSDAPPGSWKPDPKAFGDFARAIAERYSGTYPDPAGTGALPRVRSFQVWNEPNMDRFLTPQWEGDKMASPDRYRLLVNQFYREAHAVHSNNQVVGPSLAPYGVPLGGSPIRPVLFLRELFCLQDRKQPKPKANCPAQPPHLDAVSHHPISFSPDPNFQGPEYHAANPDDASSGDLGRVKKVVRAAERYNQIAPRGHHPIWVTEFWWFTERLNGPNVGPYAISPEQHARWIVQGLYRFWQDGASVAIYWGMQDYGDFSTALFYDNGKPKPAFAAFRFPFLTDRGKSLIAWGKTPVRGRLLIQRKRGKGWKTIKSKKVQAGETFRVALPGRPKGTFRAKVGKRISPAWKQGS